MNESKATSYLNGLVNEIDPSVRIWKISDRFNRGVPDVRYAGTLGSMYVEFKYIPKSPRRPINPKLSAHQKKWLREEYGVGTHIAVIVITEGGVQIYPDISWEKPKLNLVTKKEAAQWIVDQVSPR